MSPTQSGNNHNSGARFRADSSWRVSWRSFLGNAGPTTCFKSGDFGGVPLCRDPHLATVADRSQYPRDATLMAWQMMGDSQTVTVQDGLMELLFPAITPISTALNLRKLVEKVALFALPYDRRNSHRQWLARLCRARLSCPLHRRSEEW